MRNFRVFKQAVYAVHHLLYMYTIFLLPFNTVCANSLKSKLFPCLSFYTLGGINWGHIPCMHNELNNKDESDV